MSRRSKLRRALRHAACTTRAAGAAAALLVAGTALSAAPTASAASPRRIGQAPRIPQGARALGTEPGTATVTATVALTPQDPAGLAAYADAVSTPGSPLYHHFLSVAEFARRFGATSAQATQVRDALAAQGLTVAPVSPNHLSLTVSAPAATVSGAFSTRLERYRLSDGQSGFANTSAPAVAASVSPLVQGVVGLDTLAKPAPQGLDSPQASRPPTGGAIQPQTGSGSGAQPCSAARQDGLSYGSYTADQVASAYGLSSLYAQGDLGAGKTIALFELEPYDPTDIAAYQSCYGTTAAVSNVLIDGGPGSTGAGSGEAALDIEDVIGLAPGANVEVYEGPNTSTGAFDTYQQIVTDNTAQVISTSWGLCEAYAGSGTAQAENTLFEEAAAQGQSTFAAAGDSGADDCGSGTGAAVDDPASQPYVTGVGGTSLYGSTPSATEAVWNDGSGYGAGGGGVSTLWATPSYQSGFALAQSSTSCGAGGHACRQVPDVSADADPDTGYVIYYGGGWTAFGGTSAAAPTWAALTALADGLPACAAHSARVGFANQALYTAAGTGYASDFKDVVQGGNGYDGVAGFSALTGYDMATGLGTPIAPSLAPAMCGDLVTVTQPGAQAAAPGSAQSLQLSAGSSAGTAVSWQATGLPPGLTIAAATGQITGTVTTVGSYRVNVAATDASGSAGDTSFTWTVGTPAVASPAQPAGADSSGGTGTTTSSPATPPATSTTTTARPVTTTSAPAPPVTTTTTVTAPGDGAPVATPQQPAPARGATARISRSLRLDRRGRPVLSVSVSAARARRGVRRIIVALPARLLRFTRWARRIAVRDARGHRLRATLKVRGGTLTIWLTRSARTAAVRVAAPALVVTRTRVAAAAFVIQDDVRVTVRY